MTYQKDAEGGHGGPQAVDLPTLLAVDYDVRGTCPFTIEVLPAAGGDAVASLAMTVTGEHIAGTWPLTVKPGSYFVSPGEAVGCTYSIVVSPR